MNRVDEIYTENGVPKDNTDIKVYFWLVKMFFRKEPERAIQEYIKFYNLPEEEREAYVKSLEHEYIEKNITKDNEWRN